MTYISKEQIQNFESDSELDRPIYRIMKEEHVFDLFRKSRNAMSKFGNWKDKFENFLMNCGHMKNGVRMDNAAREKMVAQCWTSERYSEAMWGIYASSEKQRYLRIKSTPRKLLTALNKAEPLHCLDLNCIGKVDYQPTLEIKRYYDDTKTKEVSHKLLFNSLLLKRKAFSHEKEIRLMRHVLFGDIDKKGLFWYDVDPHEMVTQIMADPHCTSQKWNERKYEIENKTQFRGEIKRSKIYDAPKW